MEKINKLLQASLHLRSIYLNHKEALSSAIICILLATLVIFIGTTNFGEAEQQKQFLVGVTYGGNNVQDAKTLIDKVANYTNLFVLQSGSLKNNATAVNEVGDYAVTKGLHFAAYFDTAAGPGGAVWVGTAEQRWGDMFAGVYLGDEPGGKFLDGFTTYTLTPGKLHFIGNETHGTSYIDSEITLNKQVDGTLDYRARTVYGKEQTDYVAWFFPNGNITVEKSNELTSSQTDPTNSSILIHNVLTNRSIIAYQLNGSITIEETISNSTNKIYTGGLPFGHHDAGRSYEILKDDFYTMENGSNRIAQEETYQQVMRKNAMSDCHGAAEVFVNKTRAPVEGLKNQWNISKGDFPVFTADYGLYWWDYKSGYDMVLAELGWNNSVAQEIGLVRGAANLQGKSWGTILTWKYTHAPYLADGEEIFEQMKASYEAAAQYVVLFNYAEDMSGPYGTLQEQHFQALEQFWNEVVQNPAVVHGGVKAQAVFVLPENYGWGMRRPDDVIWGIWEPNSTSNQIWVQVQSKLDQYGTKLDIVYNDPSFSVTSKYANIYFFE